MQTKTFSKISKLTLVLTLGLFAGCQAVSTPTTDSQTQDSITPTGQSTSTVQIQNLNDFNGDMTQQKLISPYNGTLPRGDVDAFNKADATKNAKFCDPITTPNYKKYCVQQANDKKSPPLQAASTQQQNCQKQTTADGVTQCIHYEE